MKIFPPATICNSIFVIMNQATLKMHWDLRPVWVMVCVTFGDKTPSSKYTFFAHYFHSRCDIFQ